MIGLNEYASTGNSPDSGDPETSSLLHMSLNINGGGEDVKKGRDWKKDEGEGSSRGRKKGINK